MYLDIVLQRKSSLELEIKHLRGIISVKEYESNATSTVAILKAKEKEIMSLREKGSKICSLLMQINQLSQNIDLIENYIIRLKLNFVSPLNAIKKKRSLVRALKSERLMLQLQLSKLI